MPSSIKPPLTVEQYEDLLKGLNQGRTRGWVFSPGARYELNALGYGSDRVAFRLPVEGHKTTVLKLQLSGLGGPFGSQTVNELLCILENRNSPLVPEVYDWGPSGTNPKWAEVEYLKKLEAHEFEDLAGISRREFEEALLELDAHWYPAMRRYEPIKYTKAHREAFLAHLQGSRARAFGRDVFELLDNCQLMPLEFRRLEHWGLSSDGELKLMDLGARAGTPTEELKRELLAW